ncbi:hypothetical protein JG688_00000514 [Phytophthora aleatoria]|uniref:3-oxoacyl-[acyl-carrier-protein] synthase, mitochondrial n=1 Tax=Phytophthora aleatoria TaxID=2496075 RepID=A0A8J5IWX5_9STRA|nr:hypothetical protein JG688_00000514 [Phytophthora aleatoria]
MMLAARRRSALARNLSTLSFAPPPPVPPRRVVVTGLGAVTPFGVGVERAWEHVLDSQCAIQSLDMLVDSGLNCTVGATVPRGNGQGVFHTKDWTNPKSFRAQEVDHVAMALAAADEALKNSGWTPQSDEERERAGVAIGAACGNIQEVMNVGELIREKKFRRVTPFFVPRILINLVAGHVSIEHGLKYNDRPKEASRPFDSKCDGFVMGEGAGIVVLEEYEHAKKRSARIYAELRGSQTNLTCAEYGTTTSIVMRPSLRVTRGFSTLSFGAPPPAPNRRVVVTGLGAVTPFGVGVSRSWDALLDSQCAIQTVDALADTGLSCTIGAAVPRGEGDGAFRTKDWVNLKNLRAQEPDFIAFTLAAAEEALKDSGWSPQSDEERERAGVAIGAGMGNIQEVMDVGQLIKDKKYRRVSPFFITRILINLAAGHVSIEHGLKGPNHSCVTACATGSHSIGDAANLIRHGNADVMVAGGTEASLNEISVCAFSRAQALSTKFNDRPQEASRPFDSERDGFVMGEGAGVVVLEEYEHAKKRGAKIYAEVRGYGLSGDSNHITAPLETGDGARRAMGAAIAQSGLALSDIGYINAHATSTPLGDRAENAAVKELFGEHANELAMSSTKGAIGHLLGAAGAVEAIFSIKALHHNVMPPTLNLTETTEEFTLNYVPNQPQEKELRAVLTNSFGFGGTNASLLFAK